MYTDNPNKAQAPQIDLEKLKKGAKGMKRGVPCFFFVVARTLLVFPRGRTKERTQQRHALDEQKASHISDNNYTSCCTFNAGFEEKAREYSRRCR
jgi:hypothetical protein